MLVYVRDDIPVRRQTDLKKENIEAIVLEINLHNHKSCKNGVWYVCITP